MLRNPPFLFGIATLGAAIALHFVAAGWNSTAASSAATAEVLLGAMGILLLVGSLMYRKH
jgi:hypothetical protein